MHFDYARFLIYNKSLSTKLSPFKELTDTEYASLQKDVTRHNNPLRRLFNLLMGKKQIPIFIITFNRSQEKNTIFLQAS